MLRAVVRVIWSLNVTLLIILKTNILTTGYLFIELNDMINSFFGIQLGYGFIKQQCNISSLKVNACLVVIMMMMMMIIINII